MELPIYAFALMPDHLHLLIGPYPMPVGYVVQALKLASVHRLMRDGMAGGALWQRGYWDVAMRDELSLHQAMEYIHNNPAKEGLVGNPPDYALSSCGEWFGVGKSPIQLAKNDISFVT